MPLSAFMSADTMLKKSTISTLIELFHTVDLDKHSIMLKNMNSQQDASLKQDKFVKVSWESSQLTQ